jgi:hypothetical protein
MDAAFASRFISCLEGAVVSFVSTASLFPNSSNTTGYFRFSRKTPVRQILRELMEILL